MSYDDQPSPASQRGARVGRWLGPASFVALWLAPAGSLDGEPKRLLAAVVWMAVWWVTEAVPLAATSLLPLVLFPLLDLRAVGEVAPNYSNHMVFLFLGGFVLALAVERSGLHRRIALAVLGAVGSSPRRLVWGFLLTTAMLSMWLSNTATALMMLPIAGAVTRRVDTPGAAARVFLAVAYGASIGGIGTLVGTPPNLVLAGMAPSLVPGITPISFGGWMLFGVPLVLVFLPIVGLILGRGLGRGGGVAAGFDEERRALGPVTAHERRVAVLFSLTALAWVTRAGLDFGSVSIPGWSQLLVRWDLLSDAALVTDAVPAIAAAVLATLLPAGTGDRRPLLLWSEIEAGVPWGVLLLFGGGFAIADGVRAAALDTWLAESLSGLAVLPLPLVVLTICLITTSATELTSNTATATLLMPVMAALATVLGVHPYLTMVPAVVSASCAFMLPVATPPNAIVIGSGAVSIKDLVREGLWLNLVGVIVTTVLVLTLGRLVLPM
ncbi:MAG: SLC13 family permease [Thermoanaerobaculales bacterium]|nr:SLC13 family permease [Thermoanaerobaculales bacterium]